jgi:hypothetical protein
MMTQENMNTEDKRQERRGGFYWFDDEPYISVTKVLEVLDKPQLRRWYAREVYLAMVKNPNLSEADALAVPFNKGNEAKNRGTTIHSIVEAFKHSKEEIDDIPEKFRPYAVSFYNWVKDNNIEILEHEKTVKSAKYKYAGTCDLIVKNRQTNEVWVCDVKTGKDIYQEAFLQVSAYKRALLENGIKIDKTGVILLGEKGYKFAEGGDYFNYFLSALELWKFVHHEDCVKLGFVSVGGKVE